MQAEAVTLLTDGVLRVMAHLGMLQDAPTGPNETSPAVRVLTAFEWVYAKNAGMFYPAVAAGDAVESGQEVGRIGSLFGDTLEQVVSPVNGRVLFLTINPAVQANGLLMGIGTIDGE
jgi:hypothetical protein